MQYFDALEKTEALRLCAKSFYERGWMYGTAGNLSARVNDASFLITASGKPKGQLIASDFVTVDIISGELLSSEAEGNHPSAETSIHQTIYSLYPETNACFHVHSVDACIATKTITENSLRLPNLEMIKGFDIWEQEPNVDLPLFDNHLDVAKVANEIKNCFSQQPPKLDALMIRNHGITVWGESIQQTFNRVEILEFILSFVCKSQK